MLQLTVPTSAPTQDSGASSNVNSCIVITHIKFGISHFIPDGHHHTARTKTPTWIEQQRLSSSQQTNGHQRQPTNSRKQRRIPCNPRSGRCNTPTAKQRTDFNIQTAVGSSFGIGAASRSSNRIGD
ncbi:hypothetical protein Nepgr_023027 [Nepenthes gracilis]|uniref:Uncharacterized protein n=1 Tax=Nepenthes gracilis TaxID=150966 RepID=A0AAD3T0J0_NEPGR|nr:hypothetical protein Nepgr_023027 [Nepenthes gracilis]